MAATGTGAAKSQALSDRGGHNVPPDQETCLELVPRKPPKSEGVVVKDGIVASAAVISVDDIYRAPDAGTEMGIALRLLREAVSNCEDALLALDNHEPIGADAFMLRAGMTLPELFCCRVIGDGYAEIINAVQSAFENLDGELFSLVQIRAVKNALTTVRNEPRMTFERSLDLVSMLEEAGLKTEPSDIDKLAEWLDD
jgi:hypothetical protein